MKNKTPIPQPRSPSKSFANLKNIVSEKEHGFTLIELIVVIIIVGILAAVGITQYSSIVEQGRIAEAKVRIGVMLKLAQEYNLNNGTTVGITNSYAGVDNTCSSTDYYKYHLEDISASRLWLGAQRCTSGGKQPNGSSPYQFAYDWNPQTGIGVWRCRAYPDDGTPCYGYSY